MIPANIISSETVAVNAYEVEFSGSQAALASTIPLNHWRRDDHGTAYFEILVTKNESDGDFDLFIGVGFNISCKTRRLVLQNGCIRYTEYNGFNELKTQKPKDVNVKLQVGDRIGCGLTSKTVNFTYNGIVLAKESIDGLNTFHAIFGCSSVCGVTVNVGVDSPR